MTTKALLPVRDRVRERRTSLLPLLLRAHEAEGYLSPAAITRLSRQLRISENEIYGVATFHPQFRFRPPGKYRIQVCVGNSCHVGGGQNFTEVMKIDKGIGDGETTPDGTFSLEGVACVGCCAMAPVVVVNGEVHGRLNRVTFMRLLESLAPSSAGTGRPPAVVSAAGHEGAGPEAEPKT